MDLKEIKDVIELMKKNSVTEFELERKDFKVRLKCGADLADLKTHPTRLEDASPLAYLPPQGAPPHITPAPRPETTSAPPKDEGLEEILAPMIGTFYRAASPESPPYVEVGDEVGPDTVVCIIEAMKVMNEIKAETRGIVAQVVVDNAKPVEFGQPLFKIRPVG